jgi:diguanylate cyclase (GGDEF)-like protein
MSERLMAGDFRAELAIQRFLEAHTGLRDAFSNVVVLDASGQLVANLNDRGTIGKENFGQRPYFLDTVSNREGVISSPFQARLMKVPVVVVTAPVFNATGRILFILVGAIDLQHFPLLGRLDALKTGENGYLFVLTRCGTILYHPDKSRILVNVKQEAGGAMPSTLAALAGYEGWIEGRSKRGVKALIAYKGLSRADWIIGAVYPFEEAFAPLIEMRVKALLASAAVATLAGLLGWFAILRLLRPLNALRKHVADMSGKDSDINVFNVLRQDEFGELSRAFFTLSQERRDAEEKLTSLTRTDPLTGLYNRRMFEEAMLAALVRANRNQRRLAVAYLDIDHFKYVNDSHGHHVGDQVLLEFAVRLKQVVRITDTVARLAGDEFVIIFDNLGDDAEALQLARKILDTIEPTFIIGELSLTITTSIGIAINAGGSATMTELMEASDKALYVVKRGGRNSFSVNSLP